MASSRYFETLTVSIGDKQLELKGSVIADRDGTINVVSTGGAFCPPTVAPADCVGQESATFTFTAHSLDSAVAVVAGQQVMATVQLSFGPSN